MDRNQVLAASGDVAPALAVRQVAQHCDAARPAGLTATGSPGSMTRSASPPGAVCSPVQNDRSGTSPTARPAIRFPPNSASSRSPRTASITYCDGSCWAGLDALGTSTGRILARRVLSVRPRVASAQVRTPGTGSPLFNPWVQGSSPWRPTTDLRLRDLKSIIDRPGCSLGCSWVHVSPHSAWPMRSAASVITCGSTCA